MNASDELNAVIEDSDSAETGFPWYAVHVRSNFERTVSRTLADRGYELFFPAYPAERRWSDRVKQIDVPLFPGYLFCRLDPRHLLPVLSAKGVVQVVGRGATPVPIAEEEINSVKAVLASRLPCAPWPVFVPGQPVVVESGPLMGVQGVLLQTRLPHRLIVSINMLQRSVAVEVDINWVRPVSDGWQSNTFRNAPFTS
jgi:transcription antitermination factor NusG